jgi:hypothetical protein
MRAARTNSGRNDSLTPQNFKHAIRESLPAQRVRPLEVDFHGMKK